MGFAGSRLGLGRAAARSLPAELAEDVARRADRASPFGPVRQIKAGALDIGYVDLGPRTGRPVMLLHGWPYDIHSFADVAPMLASAGYRVVVPHLRGHGTTRFLSADALRNGQQAVVALDVVALIDALQIQRPILAGYDWGARTANIIGALWPERCKAMVSVNGYLINNRERNKLPLPPKVEQGWWYQFYFATERGRAGYDANRRDFVRLIWKTNSPTWAFSDADLDRAMGSLDNPDHVGIVIHNYRWRLSLADGESRYDALEARLADGPAGDPGRGPQPAAGGAARLRRRRHRSGRLLNAPPRCGGWRPLACQTCPHSIAVSSARPPRQPSPAAGSVFSSSPGGVPP